MKFVVAIALVLASQIVCAQDNQGTAIAGAGAFSCGKYAGQVAFRSPTILWMQGMLSGLNTARAIEKKPMFLLPDSDSIGLYLDKYCRDNPLSSIYEGGITLWVDVSRRPENAQRQ
jgi:hypothetical protein